MILLFSKNFLLSTFFKTLFPETAQIVLQMFSGRGSTGFFPGKVGWDRIVCLVIFHGNTILLSRTNMDNMDKTAAEVLQGMIYGIEATYGRLYIWSVMEVTDKSHLSSFLGLVHNNGKRTRDEKCGPTTICDLYGVKRL